MHRTRVHQPARPSIRPPTRSPAHSLALPSVSSYATSTVAYLLADSPGRRVVTLICSLAACSRSIRPLTRLSTSPPVSPPLVRLSVRPSARPAVRPSVRPFWFVTLELSALSRVAFPLPATADEAEAPDDDDNDDACASADVTSSATDGDYPDLLPPTPDVAQNDLLLRLGLLLGDTTTVVAAPASTGDGAPSPSTTSSSPMHAGVGVKAEYTRSVSSPGMHQTSSAVVHQASLPVMHQASSPGLHQTLKPVSDHLSFEPCADKSSDQSSPEQDKSSDPFNTSPISTITGKTNSTFIFII